jgi:hypothetical protein
VVSFKEARMADLTFVDAAYPSGISGGPYDGVCYYIGGDTPHVWTIAELEARPEQYRLPIFVRSDPAGIAQAVQDVHTTLAQLAAFKQPKGTLVCLDVETARDPTYTASYSSGLLAFGYKLLVYGSQSDVFGNDNPDGLYFGASWTGVPHIAAGDQMTQYVSLSGYDKDLAESQLPLWDTKPAPIAFPQPVYVEDSMIVLNELVKGGPAVCLPIPTGKVKLLIYADQGFNSKVQPSLRVGFAPGALALKTAEPTWETPLAEPIPAGANRFTIARLDDGNVPVTVDFA